MSTPVENGYKLSDLSALMKSGQLALGKENYESIEKRGGTIPFQLFARWSWTEQVREEVKAKLPAKKLEFLDKLAARLAALGLVIAKNKLIIRPTDEGDELSNFEDIAKLHGFRMIGSASRASVMKKCLEDIEKRFGNDRRELQV